jgi:pilus assembly protein CpaD
MRLIMGASGSFMSKRIKVQSERKMKRTKFQSGQKQGNALCVILFALGLAGCASQQATFDSNMPPDYEARHPIELTTSTESATINVGIAGAGIGSFERGQVESFGQAFRADGEGALAIGIPVGSVNEKQAANAARTVRSIFMEQGLPAKAIIYRPYKANAGTEAPPLLLSYRRLRANVPSSCGVVDNLDLNSDNLQYQDFGCSTQNNFAAQLANPNDLVMPRPMDKASAERRAKVLQDFNANGNKELKGGSSTSSSGSSSQ